MSELFLKIINMSISASWIVIAVVLIRLLLKKAPKWITVFLWGIVALRLICPFNFECAISLIPSAETVSPEIMMDSTPEINTGVNIVNQMVNPIINASFAPDPMASANPLQILIPIFSVIWLTGIAAFFAYTLISYVKLKRRVSTAVLLQDNIYQSEKVISTFVLGIIKPKIYLPFDISECDMQYVIAHEKAHIKRKDHLWKPLGFLLLSIHWFNPFMWLGYILLCRDVELACDEKVISGFGREEKANYSQVLLTCSINRRMISACPLAFGEVGVKGRVKSVLNYKKPTFWIILIGTLAIFITAVCFLTNPKTTLDAELTVFIDCQISEHYNTENTSGNFIVEHYEVLDIDKSASETTVYMWVLYQEYNRENGKIVLKTEAHSPTVITAKRTGKHGHYELVEYWDANNYSDEQVKAKFPSHLHGELLDKQRYIDKQREICKKSSKEYYKSFPDKDGAGNANVEKFDYIQAYSYKWEKDRACLILTPETKKCSFEFSLLSSYYPRGTYEESTEKIVMKTDDGKNKYTFIKDGENLIFDAKNSSALPSYSYSSYAKPEICIPDKAVLKKDDYLWLGIDQAVYDVDNDGKEETCVMRYGPTSGLFTFILEIYENGTAEYYNIFYSAAYKLSFVQTDNSLKIRGVLQDEITLFDISFKDGNAVLSNGTSELAYWGGQGISAKR